MSTLIVNAAQGLGQVLAQEGVRQGLIQAGASLAAGAVSRLIPGPRVEGRRLESFRVTRADEGAPIPEIFGRMRIAGQLIWAARFRETSSQERPGGKSGPRVTQYRYSLSFALGLCAGPVARIGRVWANNEPFSLARAQWRLHKGDRGQAPDPLIELVEGVDATPAFRDLAYIVFEDLPLDAFGDRLPNFEFEILRPLPRSGNAVPLEQKIQAVNLIPGSGEFALATSLVDETFGAGRARSLNAHAQADRADIEVALDQLAADLPALGHVNLVVGWFGSDLRAGLCQIRPGVETRTRITNPADWLVAGTDRNHAYVISQTDQRANYGGTPSDASVVEAVRAIKARGFTVGLYPFLFMDIPAGNLLPDPYGAGSQAAFPWRGRITGVKAPGLAGTSDQTQVAAQEIAHFFGSAQAADFSVTRDAISYRGTPQASWSRFILHYAALAQLAGGVDFFLVGSELRGLTSLRSSRTQFPAIDALRRCAHEARILLGARTRLTYAADWSEYFGYHPQDGTGDVFFHLDPLWADPDIDCIGVDFYPPLSDWRDGSDHADARQFSDIHDPIYLASQIEGGEHFDFYYADANARLRGERSAIKDGLYQKPWIYRAKDLRNFWARPHFERLSDVEASQPTAWIAGSKPIVLTEYGVPAIDKGTNSPNLFYDPKSAESAFPPFSRGTRDDLIQRNGIEALLDYWSAPGRNPTSLVDGRPMLDLAFSAAWAWDARPFPEFPTRNDLWGDGPNWNFGHWLNGRVGLAPLDAVIRHLCGLAQLEVVTDGIHGIVAGYEVAGATSLLSALAPLALAYDFDFDLVGGRLRVQNLQARRPILDWHVLDWHVLDRQIADGVRDPGSPTLLNQARSDASEQPDLVEIRFIAPANDHQIALAAALPATGSAQNRVRIDLPLALETSQAQAIAQTQLTRLRARGRSISGKIGPHRLDVQPGDWLRVDNEAQIFRIEELTGNWEREFHAIGWPGQPGRSDPGAAPPLPAISPIALLALDLAWAGSAGDDARPWIGVFSDPINAPVGVEAGVEAGALRERARLQNNALIGQLTEKLALGPAGRWDEANRIRVRLWQGALRAQSRALVLAGANLCAIETRNGYEIVQFAEARLLGDGIWECAALLRQRYGSAAEAVDDIPAGAHFVLLDDALMRANLGMDERFAPLIWQARSLSQPASISPIQTFRHESRASRPLAPAQARARRKPEGVRFGWIRQSRLGGEAFDADEIPLGESLEAYRFTLLSAGIAMREWSLNEAQLLYTNTQEMADFGAVQSTFEVEIAQISALWGPGTPLRRRLGIVHATS